ncbi:hypothetical protein [Sphingomonas yantingensis]|uniref:Uncharacterized protein n=1 Tax=Sphingomonas yantingensis TaxID=1241761 RepID=A0A7W9AMG4_9SPHN|nr:hypothetical protein [Sphingomonas yantingensis]MBB5697190.1 hypothetical protein [Sphingomonas yantingensis]
MRIVTSAEAHANLDAAAQALDCSHTMCSRALGRGDGYIGRHIREGVPALLSDRDALTIADFLGSDARLFGVVMPPKPKPVSQLPWWRKPMPTR